MFKKSLARAFKQCFSEQIKPPPNPTMTYGANLTRKDLEKLLDPMGFLKDHEKSEVEKAIKEAKEMKDILEALKGKPEVENKGMPKEVGFKVKGLEPTRYGDWERNGRVSDF